MEQHNNAAFISLFKAAYDKCFKRNLITPATEAECKHLSAEIFAATGLTIGAKSLKNYSIYVANGDIAKAEKPSVATLDTLARYVLNAPYTNEIARKNNENNFPWWFQYQGNFVKAAMVLPPKQVGNKRQRWIAITLPFSIILLIGLLHYLQKPKQFKEDFHTVADDSLFANGWMLKHKDTAWWNKRNTDPKLLTLYTLTGDNWADSSDAPNIKNLLINKLPGDCFETEIQLKDFVPRERWQQAGILLLEDTTLASKSIRLSLAYNNFFGGYDHPAEIIVQAIASNPTDLTKPEEIVHHPVASFTSNNDRQIVQNLVYSSLKIIKKGKWYRFLYAVGEHQNFAYKEVLNTELDVKPKYAAIFALQGFGEKSHIVPVKVKSFNLMVLSCD